MVAPLSSKLTNPSPTSAQEVVDACRPEGDPGPRCDKPIYRSQGSIWSGSR